MEVVVVWASLLPGPSFHGSMQSNELAGLGHEGQALSWSMDQGTGAFKVLSHFSVFFISSVSGISIDVESQGCLCLPAAKRNVIIKASSPTCCGCCVHC